MDTEVKKKTQTLLDSN